MNELEMYRAITSTRQQFAAAQWAWDAAEEQEEEGFAEDGRQQMEMEMEIWDYESRNH